MCFLIILHQLLVFPSASAREMLVTLGEHPPQSVFTICRRFLCHREWLYLWKVRKTSVHLGSVNMEGYLPTGSPAKGPAGSPSQHELMLPWSAQSDAESCLYLVADSLIGVADRIDGPYNVDTVIGTIHMRIAEAISNLQENKDSITSKVGACAWAWLRTHHVQLPGPNALLCSLFS